MKDSLFAPSPNRKRGLILTLAGSLLFHGSLIGVAALWPTRPVAPPLKITEIGLVDPEPPGPQLPPSSQPSEPDPAPPVAKVSEPTDDQPPIVETDPNDLTLSTPVPRAATRAPSRPSSATSQVRTTHAPGNLPVGGPTSGVSGSPGAGVRWNKPKPVYPPSLRAAHIQGSGSIRVTTDASGHVVSAVITQSTGNALLDDNTCRAAKRDWSGPPNSALSVPVTYRLQ